MTTRGELPPCHVAFVNDVVQTPAANAPNASVVSLHKFSLSQGQANKLHRIARVDHALIACGAPNVLCNVAVKCHGRKLRYCEMCNAVNSSCILASLQARGPCLRRKISLTIGWMYNCVKGKLMLCGVPRVAPIDLAVSQGSKPIHEGTSSGRNHHIDNNCVIQYPG